MGHNNEAHKPKQIQDLRCPRIGGLPVDTVHFLHRSLAQLIILRRGLEDSNIQIERAKHAVFEARTLLERLRTEGF